MAGLSWWRHQMETYSALLAICAGNSPVPGEFPAQRPVTRSFDVSLFSARINGWVNNGQACDLRRHRAHYDVIVMFSALQPSQYRHQQPWHWPCRINGSFSSTRKVFNYLRHISITSTVYWCIASKLKAPWNFYWMSNMFLWVEIFLFFECYHVVPKRHSQLDYELNGL